MEERNIVLICLDSVRKDIYDKYFEDVTNNPSIKFDKCRSASTWSVPSHASFLTGLVPSEHGIHCHNLDFSSIEQDTYLGDKGYTTIGISANGYANSDFGFDTLFDEFVNIFPGKVHPNGRDVRDYTHGRSNIEAYLQFILDSIRGNSPTQDLTNGFAAFLSQVTPRRAIPQLVDDGARTITKKATRFVEKNDGKPFLMFLNFMDAHEPLSFVRGFDKSFSEVPTRWSSDGIDFVHAATEEEHNQEILYYKTLYEASVEYLYRNVCKMIEKIDSNTESETTFIIFSDHGENFGEKSEFGQWGHVYCKVPTESLLHVPFEIVNPPRKQSKTINEEMSLMDLPNIIQNLKQGCIPNEFDSRPLLSETIGMGVAGGYNSMKESISKNEFESWDHLKRCAYVDGNKYVWSSSGEERVLSYSDEMEGDEVPDDVKSLFNSNISEYKLNAKTESNIEVSAQVEDRLSDLGYT